MKDIYSDFYSKLIPVSTVKRDDMNQLVCSNCGTRLAGGGGSDINHFCKYCGFHLDWSYLKDVVKL